MDAITTVVKFFQDGGLFMYPIVLVLAVGLAIAVERILYLRSAKSRNRAAWDALMPLAGKGRYDAALSQVEEADSPLARVLSYGLERARDGSDRDEVEMAMEESLMEVMPLLEKRTPFLATFANIATLLGLLGTIIGLIQGFQAVANVNPAEKANLLSESISIAMNTTAFGLTCAIPLLLLHAWLQAKTTEIVDALEMATVKFLNLISDVKKRAGQTTAQRPAVSTAPQGS